MVNLKNPLVASYDIPGERQWCYSNPAPHGGIWTSEMREAFHKLKRAIQEAPSLGFIDLN